MRPTPAKQCSGSEHGAAARPKLRKGQQRRLAAQARDRACSVAGGAPGRCGFFIEKKQRYCTQRPGVGEQRCSAHGGKSTQSREMGSAQPVHADDVTPARVPCPIDPAHSVFAHKLQRHLAVCSAAKQQEAHRALPFFCANANTGCQRPSVAAEVVLSLEPAIFAEEVKSLYDAHVGPLRAAMYTVGETQAGADGRPSAVEHLAEKHVAQNTSILENMFGVGLLNTQQGEERVEAAQPPPVFVEFGAGRGLLSLALRKRMGGAPVILVERKLQRQKALRRRQGVANARGADDTLRQTERNAAWARLRIDIRDLRLSRSPLIAPSSAQLKETTPKTLDRDNGEMSHMPTGCAVGGTIHDDSRGRCVAMSKHLCGVATDLALRCLRNAATDTVATNGPHAGVGISTEQCAPCAAVAQSSTQEPETLHSTAIPAVPARRPAVRVEGVAIALCCHHCMIWSDYVGRQYFEKVLGIGEDGFEALRSATSWCTDRAQSCCTRTSDASCSVDSEKPGLEPELEESVPAELPELGFARLDAGLSPAVRAATGRRCKRLLDAGRLWWLRQPPVGSDAGGAGAEAELGLGMDGELVEYVDEGTSLENCMLLAWPRNG